MTFEKSSKPNSPDTSFDLNPARQPDWLGSLMPLGEKVAAFQLADSATAPKDTGKAVKPSVSDPPPEACLPSKEYQEIIATVALTIDDPKKLGNINKLANRHNCQIHSVEDAVKFAREEIRAIDAHSDLEPMKQFNSEISIMQNNMQGIGARISRKGANTSEGPITITKVLDNSPADKVGLKAGDVLEKIDGNVVSNLTLNQAIEKIRGDKGTDVILNVVRNGEKRDFKITRDKVDWPDVSSELLPGNIAYIKLDSFEKLTSAMDVMNVLKKYESANAVILDLRNNVGGPETTAMLVSSLFMDKGVINTVRARVQSSPFEPKYSIMEHSLTSDSLVYRTQEGTKQYPRLPYSLNGKPTALLVNEYTASSSEIVAGALKDHKIATLIGTKTLGKGVGQTFVPNLPGDTALRITFAKTHTPSGRWVGDGDKEKIGLEPDIKVENPKGTEFGSKDDAQLMAARNFLTREVQRPWYQPRWLVQ